ncbi:uncharacterized protein LOC128546919 [Mercenaria mercenaria]|uniref:uncharacterized protein LOC128546919 n=1 Tax=Mercenaria mercenaria TaxID=6596 RepID=UPI00234F4215|nr:uncharacterized protein LOC128546919 [Mercenaria mercenaria]
MLPLEINVQYECYITASADNVSRADTENRNDYCIECDNCGELDSCVNCSYCGKPFCISSCRIPHETTCSRRSRLEAEITLNRIVSRDSLEISNANNVHSLQVPECNEKDCLDYLLVTNGNYCNPVLRYSLCILAISMVILGFATGIWSVTEGSINVQIGACLSMVKSLIQLGLIFWLTCVHTGNAINARKTVYGSLPMLLIVMFTVIEMIFVNTPDEDLLTSGLFLRIFVIIDCVYGAAIVVIVLMLVARWSRKKRGMYDFNAEITGYRRMAVFSTGINSTSLRM